MPAFDARQGRDPAVAIATILARQADDVGRRSLCIIGHTKLVALALNAKIKDLEARKAELEQKIEQAPTAPRPLLHPSLADLYRRKVAELADLLEDTHAKHEAFELIRGLVDVIRLVPEDGELRIELRGALAGILALCAEGKQNQPGRFDAAGLDEQFKLVAGVGFEPTTFRL